MINKHLVKDLLNLGMWNEGIKNKLIMENGSVQNIPEIPTQVKEVYKTVWEMSQKRILQMAANRSIFIDQSQSLNLFLQDANYAKLTSMHFYAWKSGLKTGMYYLRTKSAVDAIKFTLNNDKAAAPIEVKEQQVEVKKLEAIAVLEEPSEMTAEEYRAMIELAKNAGPEDCEMCGS
jgi:ribonucleoside-diphosphate reductase alpha chain